MLYQIEYTYELMWLADEHDVAEPNNGLPDNVRELYFDTLEEGIKVFYDVDLMRMDQGFILTVDMSGHPEPGQITQRIREISKYLYECIEDESLLGYTEIEFLDGDGESITAEEYHQGVHGGSVEEKFFFHMFNYMRDDYRKVYPPRLAMNN